MRSSRPASDTWRPSWLHEYVFSSDRKKEQKKNKREKNERKDERRNAKSKVKRENRRKRCGVPYSNKQSKRN